jgi:hypothetical protein
MMQAAIAAKISGPSAPSFAAKGQIQLRNYGERLSIRGGHWGDGADAGVAALILGWSRSIVYGSVGFRPAFIG